MLQTHRHAAARFPFLRIVAALVLCSPAVVHAQVAQAVSGVAAAIEAEINAQMNPDHPLIQGESIAWAERLHEFYTRRAFKPAWANPAVAQQLRKALADSHADGLDPADYHAPLLTDLAVKVSAPTATDVLRAQNDILMTDAVLRLAYHLSFGKVDAESFDAQWNYGRVLARRDVSQEIEDAIASQSVYQRVEALKPTHPLYASLKRELARYREAEATGGWPALGAGPTLKPGMSDARVVALRERMIAGGDLDRQYASDSTQYDAPLEAAVKQFQERMGLAADGAAGAGTIAALNVPIADRIRQLRVNLDRGRVLLQDLPNEFVVVNIAGFTIYFVRGQQVVWDSRVQVGKTYRQTPIFRSQISYLVWNPTWTVPPGIIKGDILPAARRDPSSITRRGLKVLDSAGREVDPASVDWSRYNSGYIPYTLRQDAGPGNALGSVKFMFPNPYMVYLHDTPSRGLFDAADRAFSSGCVRVERPLELAKLLLAEPDKWNDASMAGVIATHQTQNVTLRTKVPVLLAYWTAWVDPQGRVNFRRDLYGQDAKWAAGLNAPFKIRSRPLFAPASETSS